MDYDSYNYLDLQNLLPTQKKSFDDNMQMSYRVIVKESNFWPRPPREVRFLVWCLAHLKFN